MRIKSDYFSTFEKILWIVSVTLITAFSVFFDRGNYLSLCSSLVGVSSLIFISKGNPVGQILMILFSLFYGAISFSFHYYGEMITYLGMTLPMSVFSLISWIRHPSGKGKSEVKVRRIGKKEVVFLCFLSAGVTAGFYFLLSALGNANLIPATVSIFTSFVADYLVARRSPAFALWYTANDVVLIVLWTLASVEDLSYLSVVICFLVFFANDFYSFWNWRRMEKRQKEGREE